MSPACEHLRLQDPTAAPRPTCSVDADVVASLAPKPLDQLRVHSPTRSNDSIPIGARRSWHGTSCSPTSPGRRLSDSFRVAGLSISALAGGRADFAGYGTSDQGASVGYSRLASRSKGRAGRMTRRNWLFSAGRRSGKGRKCDTTVAHRLASKSDRCTRVAVLGRREARPRLSRAILRVVSLWTQTKAMVDNAVSMLAFHGTWRGIGWGRADRWKEETELGMLAGQPCVSLRICSSRRRTGRRPARVVG